MSLDATDYEAARNHVRIAEHWGLITGEEMRAMLGRVDAPNVTDDEVISMRNALQARAVAREREEEQGWIAAIRDEVDYRPREALASRDPGQVTS